MYTAVWHALQLLTSVGPAMGEAIDTAAAARGERQTFLQWTPSGMTVGTGDAANSEPMPRPKRGSLGGLSNSSPQEVVERLREGLPFSVFDDLRDALGVSTRSLADTTSIAPRTLARRKSEGRLRKDESERVLRIGALYEQAGQVLESPDAARRWLKSPKQGLGGFTPLEYADTEPGARAVEALLTRLEYGVFS
jgi:putative toxin-antitoxin system antitoxin component (TIGR02293 family)